MKYEIEYWETASLIEYAKNPRKNDHAVDKLASVIREFGFRVPILAKSDKTVVDGHLRLKAAKKLGLDEVPVMLADDMTETQIKAFRIAVNRMAEIADWDMDLLKVEAMDLDGEGFDMSLLGFGKEEMAQWFLEPDFVPGTEDDQGRLDQLEPKWCDCPNCGERFDLREHGQG